MKTFFPFASVLLLVLFSSCAHSDPGAVDAQSGSLSVPDDNSAVAAWTRAPGQYTDGRDVKRQHLMMIDVGRLKQTKARRTDYQSGERSYFQGARIQDVIAAYQYAGDADLVLFHFANGMIIPMPADPSDAVFAKLDAILAVATSSDGKTWSSEFPAVTRKDPIMFRRDNVPITFGANRVVVSGKPWPLSSDGGFSPWRYVSSLTGLEFVRKDAYEAQFAVAKHPEAVRGLKVFQERCQFCHGVRQVGATFGWDYVKPLPLYQKRNDETLYSHIRYPKLDLGTTIMPAQASFSKEDAHAIWEWMKAVSQHPLKAYAP